MPTLLERLAARLAYYHAGHTYRSFVRTLRRTHAVQKSVLRAALNQLRGSDFSRHFNLDRVRTVDEFRRAVPIMTYDDHWPWIERVAGGETHALFRRGTPLIMFATSSGTTARQKLVPVTPTFVREYRRGWNTFGLKLFSDHPQAVLRAILQSTGRYDSSRSPSGIPCGAITGLLARTQKRIVRRFYVGKPEIANLESPQSRYYALMRLGAERDVAFAITANPATLIQLARTMETRAAVIIRDIRDGTIDADLVPDDAVRAALLEYVQPNPARARELESIVDRCGNLRPRDVWRLTFLACWTGGSMGHYLPRLPEYWGTLPIRDIGLLASEGRISIPLADESPAGVLDIRSGFLEFMPLEEWGAGSPSTRLPHELEPGRRYVVVLTNFSGLCRYRLDDVVRVVDRFEGVPVVEFLHRAGRVSSLTGEKLTENQVVEAVRLACRARELATFDFIACPVWSDPPSYRLNTELSLPQDFATHLDTALRDQNAEYADRRTSGRLGPVTVRHLAAGTLARFDSQLLESRGGAAEQYKRPCLFTAPGEDVDKLRTGPP
ncbi:GH3 auxin-responsive promoter [Phycisphaerae bacterium RAS1]|nr:GH3 auxin-responsive promoter [Phycisphaerae bacterium RAS1]